jgi:hypothetical protein
LYDLLLLVVFLFCVHLHLDHGLRTPTFFYSISGGFDYRLTCILIVIIITTAGCTPPSTHLGRTKIQSRVQHLALLFCSSLLFFALHDRSSLLAPRPLRSLPRYDSRVRLRLLLSSTTSSHLDRLSNDALNLPKALSPVDVLPISPSNVHDGHLKTKLSTVHLLGKPFSTIYLRFFPAVRQSPLH